MYTDPNANPELVTLCVIELHVSIVGMNMRNEPEFVAGEERLLFGKLAFCSVLILFPSTVSKSTRAACPWT